MPASQLKTYRKALAQHLSRTKFRNAEHLDREPTQRRDVKTTAIIHIGKEADRWEEQLHLGLDEGAQVEYGAVPPDVADLRERLERVVAKLGHRKLAQRAGVSRQTVSVAISGKAMFVSRKVAAKLVKAIAAAELENCIEKAGRGFQRNLPVEYELINVRSQPPSFTCSTPQLLERICRVGRV